MTTNPLPTVTVWVEELKRTRSGYDQHGTFWGYKPSVRIWEWMIHDQDYDHVFAATEDDAKLLITQALSNRYTPVFRKPIIWGR